MYFILCVFCPSYELGLTAVAIRWLVLQNWRNQKHLMICSYTSTRVNSDRWCVVKWYLFTVDVSYTLPAGNWLVLSILSRLNKFPLYFQDTQNINIHCNTQTKPDCAVQRLLNCCCCCWCFHCFASDMCLDSMTICFRRLFCLCYAANMSERVRACRARSKWLTA